LAEKKGTGIEKDLKEGMDIIHLGTFLLNFSVVMLLKEKRQTRKDKG